MKVYVAGPYSKGDVALNVRTAIEAADQLAERHFCPYIPHLSHFWHLMSPKPYEWWLTYDAMWLLECDAVLRIPGESEGAEKEVRLAQQRGLPVVSTIEELEAIREERTAAQKRWFIDNTTVTSWPFGERTGR